MFSLYRFYGSHFKSAWRQLRAERRCYAAKGRADRRNKELPARYQKYPRFNCQRQRKSPAPHVDKSPGLLYNGRVDS